MLRKSISITYFENSSLIAYSGKIVNRFQITSLIVTEKLLLTKELFNKYLRKRTRVVVKKAIEVKIK